jgi:hypothetical protein
MEQEAGRPRSATATTSRRCCCCCCCCCYVAALRLRAARPSLVALLLHTQLTNKKVALSPCLCLFQITQVVSESCMRL